MAIGGYKPIRIHLFWDEGLILIYITVTSPDRKSDTVTSMPGTRRQKGGRTISISAITKKEASSLALFIWLIIRTIPVILRVFGRVKQKGPNDNFLI
jgi:hypothetical protein